MQKDSFPGWTWCQIYRIVPEGIIRAGQVSNICESIQHLKVWCMLMFRFNHTFVFIWVTYLLLALRATFNYIYTSNQWAINENKQHKQASWVFPPSSWLCGGWLKAKTCVGVSVTSRGRWSVGEFRVTTSPTVQSHFRGLSTTWGQRHGIPFLCALSLMNSISVLM